MKPLMLVDANNLAMRAIKATERVPLSADGVSTAALHVFIQCLSHHVLEEQPERLVVCWDGGKSIYRVDLDPGYKANRHTDPDDDERKPFGLMKQFLTLAGIHHVEREGWEADDLIACYWKTITPIDTPLVVVSSDKDLLQLLDSNSVQVRVSSKPPTDRWTAQRVRDEYGCDPGQLSKMMALAGDVGDNVPGIRGIGPKKAVKALKENGWHLDDVLSGYDQTIRDRVLLSYRLVDLTSVRYYSLGLRLEQPPVFTPTDSTSVLWPVLDEYLSRYRLAKTRDRLLDGTLWGRAEAVA